MGLRTWIYQHTGIKLKRFGSPTFQQPLNNVQQPLNNVQQPLNNEMLPESERLKLLDWLNWFYYSRADFEKYGTPENLQNLVAGLDVDSVETVNLCISRIKAALAGEKYITFTAKEQANIDAIYNTFRPAIRKVNDDCYAYNDYLLPLRAFEEPIYFDRYGDGRIFDHTIFKNKDIIDAGGFIGDAALFLSRWTDKNVYVFEPSSENFPLIQKTIELNHSKNIIPIQKALGAKTETLFFTKERFASHITNDANADNVEKVDAISLDEFVQQNGLNIGLIKVDVEGAEPQFLAGARKTIAAQRPIILLSIYHNFHDFFMLKPMLESWKLNYQFHIHKGPNIFFWWFETLLICIPK